MKDIKERHIVKDVKLLQRTVHGADKTIRTVELGKEIVNEAGTSRHRSPNEYAHSTMQEGGEYVTSKGIQTADKAGRRGIRYMANEVKNRRDSKRAAKHESADSSSPDSPNAPTGETGADSPVHSEQNGPQSGPERAARQVQERQRETRARSGDGRAPKGRDTAGNNSSVSATESRAKTASKKAAARQGTGRRDHIRGKDSIANPKRSHIRGKGAADKAGRAAKSSVKTAKQGGKGTVKTAKNGVKAGKNTTKVAARTARTTAKATAKTAQATAKAAQRAAQAARAAAKATVAAIKVAVKATLAAVKAIIAATKALLAAIAAGGWIAVAIILIITMCALLFASPFGIFASDGTTPESTTTLQAVVQQVSTEFNAHIDGILQAHDYDELDSRYINRGTNRADNWIDILAVYAVYTSAREDGMEVVTVDDTRANLIREAFWAMHDIQDWLETIEHRETVTAVDEWGYEYEYEEITHTYILHLEVTGKSAWEQADAWAFNNDQRIILAEMLEPQFLDLFAPLIGNPSMMGDGSGAVGTGNYIWPSPVSDLVTSPYGSRVHPVSGEWEVHLGIDISAGNGTPVLAADGGSVTVAESHWSYGNYVMIDHGDGNKTLYAHMNQLMVSAGDTVSQGQLVGTVGSTGVSTGNHIHFETHTSSGRMNPLDFFENYTTVW